MRRVKLDYFWTDCPDGSHVAVNWTFWEGKISGSVRRWSRDTRTNVGRKFDVAPSELGRDDEGRPVLVLEGICGEPLRVPLDPARVRALESEAAPAA
jgi:hypothetical protein